MICHKFREVEAFCDHFTVLRRGAAWAGASSAPLDPRNGGDDDRRRGRAPVRGRKVRPKSGATLELAGLFAEDDEGLPRSAARPQDPGRRDPGHRRGIRQRPVRADRGPSGQRPISSGGPVRDQDFEPKRDHFDNTRFSACPRSRSRTRACPDDRRREHRVPPLRQAADTRLGWWLSPGRCAPRRAS